MRLLYLTSSLEPTDGYGRYAAHIVAGMAARGHEVMVACASDAAHEIPNVLVRPVLRQPRRYWRKRARVFRAAWDLRSEARKADLVHCLVESYYGLSAMIALRSPLVLQAVGTYASEPFVNPERCPLGHVRALRKAEAVVAISRYTLDQLEAHIKPRRSCVVYLGVDNALLTEITTEKSAHPLMVSVGSIKPRKGTLVLIEAMANVVERFNDARLHIVGDLEDDTGYARQCRERIDTLGLGEHILMRGILSDAEVDALEREAWCFVLAPQNVGAKFEGFGLVFLEAAARGLPCVGTTGSGAEEAILPGETGLLVQQGDPEALGATLVKMLEDPALRDRMGHAGRDFARRMSWDACVSELEKVYAEVLAS